MFYYDKQCKSCGTVFYHKEVGEEVFRNALSLLAWRQEGEDEIVTIQSVCNNCAETFYGLNNG